MKGEGRGLLDKLAARKVWIDAAHANEMTLMDLLPFLAEKKLPYLVTHTQFRKYYKAERGISEEEIQFIKTHDGMVALIPSEDLLSYLHSDSTATCTSGLDTFKESIAYGASLLGAERITLGSDINAPLNGLSASCTTVVGSNTHDLSKKGFYTYSQWPELARFIAPHPLTATQWNQQTLAQFLKLWRSIRP